MIAKHVTIWYVTQEYRNRAAAHKAAKFRDATIHEVNKLVCPYCEKNWPYHIDNGEPFSDECYVRNVVSGRGRIDRFCCSNLKAKLLEEFAKKENSRKGNHGSTVEETM